MVCERSPRWYDCGIFPWCSLPTYHAPMPCILHAHTHTHTHTCTQKSINGRTGTYVVTGHIPPDPKDQYPCGHYTGTLSQHIGIYFNRNIDSTSGTVLAPKVQLGPPQICTVNGTGYYCMPFFATQAEARSPFYS